MSSCVEKKLFQFDNRLKNLEVMLSLLESKLNSLPPEITNSYPELIHISLNDVNPEIVKINPALKNNNNNNNSNSFKGFENSGNPRAIENVENQGAEAPKEEVQEVISEPTAQEKLTKFVEENEDITTYYNMLK